MVSFRDSATETNISKDAPVNIDFDPVNDPVNSSKIEY